MYFPQAETAHAQTYNEVTQSPADGMEKQDVTQVVILWLPNKVWPSLARSGRDPANHRNYFIFSSRVPFACHSESKQGMTTRVLTVLSPSRRGHGISFLSA